MAITSYIVGRLFFSTRRNSSTVDKSVIINYLDTHHQDLVNECLTTSNRGLEYVFPNGENLTISKKDLDHYYEKKFSRIDLEKHDNPSIGDNFVNACLFSPLALLVLPQIGLGIIIFCFYTAFPFLLHEFRLASYSTRRNLSRFFISGGIIYRRDEVMANELIHQKKFHSNIIAIFGKAHLEGVIWHLKNHGFVNQGTYSLNEYVNTDE